jgi:hypothetical protein
MNNSIKVAYKEIHDFLELNKNKKVSTIMPELVELMSKKVNSSGHTNTFVKNEDGVVTHVYCYYHKKWEDVTVVEYGKKKGTATGLNSMCKEGVSNWTKQQRVKKSTEAGLLTKLGSGEITVEELPTLQAEILETSKLIVPREDEHGVDEL